MATFKQILLVHREFFLYYHIHDNMIMLYFMYTAL